MNSKDKLKKYKIKFSILTDYKEVMEKINREIIYERRREKAIGKEG